MKKKNWFLPVAVVATIFILTITGTLNLNNTNATQDTKDPYDVSISYANWIDDPWEYFGALNTDKLAISSVRHIPIYRIDTMNDLKYFQQLDQYALFDTGYGDVPSFNKTVAKYDNNFFADNSLMIVYVPANSGSYRYEVSNIFCDDSTFYVHVVQANQPEVATMDMAGWFITIAVSDSTIEYCSEFDADLDNTLN